MYNAQEAYNNTLLNIKHLDTTDLMIKASNYIEMATKEGYFVTGIRQIENPPLAEKFAIEMERLGYSCSVINDSPIMDQETKMLKPTCCVQINWKNLAAHSREDYNGILDDK